MMRKRLMVMAPSASAAIAIGPMAAGADCACACSGNTCFQLEWPALFLCRVCLVCGLFMVPSLRCFHGMQWESNQAPAAEGLGETTRRSEIPRKKDGNLVQSVRNRSEVRTNDNSSAHNGGT
jgi:hypothetical protein